MPMIKMPPHVGSRLIMGLCLTLGTQGLWVWEVTRGASRVTKLVPTMPREEIVIRLEWLAADLTIRRLAA